MLGDLQRVQCVRYSVQLALSSVDEQDVRPCGNFGRGVDLFGAVRLRIGVNRRVTVLLHQPGEPALHHLAHHAKIIARNDVFGTNVEFAVLVFHKALRTGHDHRADRIAAHDMGVVIDLYAPWHPRQIESLSHSAQQPGLRGCFRQTPPQCFPGILD